MKYSWPGNIRELKNVLERAVVLARGGNLNTDHFSGLKQYRLESGSIENEINLDRLEDRHIRDVLNRCNNDKKKTLKILGISRATLYRRLKSMRED